MTLARMADLLARSPGDVESQESTSAHRDVQMLRVRMDYRKWKGESLLEHNKPNAHT